MLGLGELDRRAAGPGHTRAAILAHERAHLNGHHHGLVRMVDVLARALPFVPLRHRRGDTLRRRLAHAAAACAAFAPALLGVGLAAALILLLCV